MKCFRPIVAVAFSICVCFCSVFGEPRRTEVTQRDFAYGCEITTESAGPVFRLLLPEDIYTGAVSRSLSDVRIFDGTGTQLPFEISQPAAVHRQEVNNTSLAFFPIAAPSDTSPAAADSQEPVVEIEESSSGGILNVKYRGKRSATEGHRTSFLVDTRNLELPLSALDFDWSSPQSNAIIKVLVSASDDLQRWLPLQVEGALAKLSSRGTELNENAIRLQAGRSKFLKIEFPVGEQIQVRSISGKYVRSENDVPVPSRLEVAGVSVSSDPSEYLFDAGGNFPVVSLQVILPQANSIVEYALASLTEPASTTNPVGRGRAYRLTSDGGETLAPPMEIAPTTSRYWKLRVLGKDASIKGVPRIRIGYHRHQLAFLGSGSTPYILAYGSAYVGKADFGSAIIEETVIRSGRPPAAAECGARRSLSGESVLNQPVEQIPFNWKGLILWGILLAIVISMGAMAYKLYRDLNKAR